MTSPYDFDISWKPGQEKKIVADGMDSILRGMKRDVERLRANSEALRTVPKPCAQQVEGYETN